MELQIQHQLGEVRVIVQGPENSAELQAVVALLQSSSDKLWVMDEKGETVCLLRAFCGQKQ